MRFAKLEVNRVQYKQQGTFSGLYKVLRDIETGE